ncbi:Chaperone protein dnaJ 49, partial [Ananas comosus]
MSRDQPPESKAQIVREICSAATIFTSCSHRRRSTRRPPFVDWYLILRVDEESAADVIRRRYRQLALQLHPDKNKHPRAEVAFKLVSEAYSCLSDKARRRAFNSERQESFCKECHRKSQAAAEKARANRIMIQALKEVQSRLREECRIVEKCLRSNRGSDSESPLFDPVNYFAKCADYPHCRARVVDNSKEFWYCNLRRGVKCESPVYQ